MKILLCTATTIESRACRQGILQAQAQTRFEVLKTGMGPEKARRNLELRLEERHLPPPSLIVSTGFAGSCNPEIPRGSWAIAKSIRSENEPMPIRLDETLRNFLPDLISSTHPVRIHQGSFLTLRKVLTQNTSFSETSPADFVDTESHALAELSHSRKIPFLVLRLLSDTPKAPLPKSISLLSSALISQNGTDRSIRFHQAAQGLRELVSHPASILRYVIGSRDLPELLTVGWRSFATHHLQQARPL